MPDADFGVTARDVPRFFESGRKTIALLIGGAISVFLPFGIYLVTLAAVVGFTDSGELAVVSQTLGIAHPTGYPLYTLVTHLFTWLPVGSTISRTGLFSALVASATNGLLYLCVLELFAMLGAGLRSNFRSVAIATGTALSLAFTALFWTQGNTNEVYALHLFFISLATLQFLKWQKTVREEGVGTPDAQRLFLLLAFASGLGFTNHMTIGVLMPALLLGGWATVKRIPYRAPWFWVGLGLFLGALTLYLYLPVRSAQNPLFDWGRPTNLGRFFRHVSAWQYRVWMFSGPESQIKENFSHFIALFRTEYLWFWLLPAGIGLVTLFRKNWPVGLFLLLALAGNFSYNLNYHIPDIDSYFLPFVFWYLLLGGVGIAAIISWLLGKHALVLRGIGWLGLAGTIFFPARAVLQNYPKANQKTYLFAYDYAQNFANGLLPDAVVLTSLWDHYAPWLYLHYLEGRRTDVTFIDVELCRRSWYFAYLARADSTLFQHSATEIGYFLVELRKFEQNLPYDPGTIDQAYYRMLSSFVFNNLDRPIYADVTLDRQIAPQFQRIPDGLLFRLRVPTEKYAPSLARIYFRGQDDPEVYKDAQAQEYLAMAEEMKRLRAEYDAYSAAKSPPLVP